MSTQASRSFQHLVFDLDDTLLDTYRQLLPEASRESCVAMIGAGLNADLASCLKACDEFRKHQLSHTRNEMFPHLIDIFGVRGDSSTANIARAGIDAFYNRKDRINPKISLFPHALTMLRTMKTRYSLHLVTSGSPETQNEKIRILGIRELFQSIHCVDTLKNERKFSAFSAIMRATNAPPEHHLSIGNRIDTDIAEARRLNWKTCWVRYGEYASRKPQGELETPDFIIDDISELIAICRL